MTTQTTGIVIDGQLQLDQPLALPNQSRVKVTVEASDVEAANQAAFLENLEAWKQLAKERPMGSGEVKLTREQLHERS